MKLNRRGLIYLGALGVASAVAKNAFASQAKEVKVTDLASISPLKPVSFNYPDEESPAILLDMGKPVYMGVGPKKSIVAYSSLCQHMGCPVNFDSKSRFLVCPCHMSIYDPARGGMCVEGPAISRLPRIILKVKGKSIYAVGVSQGIIYGRANNLGR
ncbi:MAG: arsenate reductase (azurin) small subunit [Aquificaceae bacterium]